MMYDCVSVMYDCVSVMYDCVSVMYDKCVRICVCTDTTRHTHARA